MCRPRILLPLVLTFAVAACGQPLGEPVNPGLSPQLGDPNTTYVVGTAFNRAGHLYSVSESDSYFYWEELKNEFRKEQVVLHRVDRHGNLLWERVIVDRNCRSDSMFDFALCGNGGAFGVALDGAGNAYSLTYDHGEACDASIHFYNSLITKVSRLGVTIWTRNVDNATALTTDPNGNVYTVGDNNRHDGYCQDPSEDTDPPYAQIVTKYSTDGKRLWQRKLAVGTPRDVVVSSSGNVYVVGDAGMSRFSSGGAPVWTKPVGASFITIAGSHLYTQSGAILRKYDGNGQQLWSRTLAGLTTPTVGDLTGDSSGNIYVVGTALTERTGYDAFVRKLSSNGKVVWTKLFGTSAYDDARGVATYNGSEVYVAGETRGVLSEANRSGSGGYLRKLDRSGNRVWTR